MVKIRDYRTKDEKEKDKLHNKIYKRYSELRGEGLKKTRACRIAGIEYGYTLQGVFLLVKRFEKQ